MMHQSGKICPRCGSYKFKPWRDLTDEEKMLVERLPGSAEYSFNEREKHLFCTRCWFECHKIENDKA